MFENFDNGIVEKMQNKKEELEYEDGETLGEFERKQSKILESL